MDQHNIHAPTCSDFGARQQLVENTNHVHLRSDGHDQFHLGGLVLSGPLHLGMRHTILIRRICMLQPIFRHTILHMHITY